MIPLAIGVGIMALLMFLSVKYERHIRVMARRYDPKIRMNRQEQKLIIASCDMVMELHPDPQSDEYRLAMELKLRLEKKLRDD